MTKVENTPDGIYLDLSNRIIEEGEVRGDRTGTGTRSIFGPQLEFDLLRGFPLLTTKKLSWNNIWTELYWFLKGETNIKFLKGEGNNIWNQWADEFGELGPVYGEMWRSWPRTDSRDKPVDQINELIENLRSNPLSRRHVISGWNPDVLPDEKLSHAENVANGKQALPPCHTMFQFYVAKMSNQQRLNYAKFHLGCEDLDQVSELTDDELEELFVDVGVPEYRLDCKLYQRSADMFLGVPYNIASYAALTTLIATMVDMAPGRFIHTFGDAHVYSNHLAQFEEQSKRQPKSLPYLDVHDRVKTLITIDELRLDDVKLVGYSAHPEIKATVAV